MNSPTESEKTEHNFDRMFVCVEYPGVVLNDEKMLQTLGGIENISTVYSEKNRRLELRFRPDDVYCKPACADRHKTSSLLVKVKVRRKKNRGADTHSGKTTLPNHPSTITNITVLGQVQTIFKFKNLCDYQFLPIDAVKPGGSMENIHDIIVPKGMLDVSWLAEDCSLFLPPAVFSRMDNMQTYLYRKETNDNTEVPPNIIGRTRRRRTGHAIFTNFDKPDMPRAPRDIALKFLNLKFLSGSHLDKLKQMFDERPIWSKNALMYLTKFTSDQLKYLLPAIAYYFVTGPWRVMWVRFGYDPRMDYTSRKYQTLDYRLRTAGGLKTKVKAKRNYCSYLLPYKSSPACKPRVAVISNEDKIEPPNKKQADLEAMDESVYIFRPGMIPPSRQMFYQYCDVEVPEIQEMLEKLPEPSADMKCHEKTGWLPSGIDERCREIINGFITETLRQNMPSSNANFEWDKKKPRKLSEKIKGSDSTDDEDDDNDSDDEDYVP